MKVVEKTQTLKMFVGGRWIGSESGETFEAISPATGEVIATLPKGTRADAARAVEAAHQARAAMAGLGAFDRAALLHRIAEAMERQRDELAHWLSLDQGKPYKAEAVGEVGEAIEYFRIAAEDIKRLETNVIPSMSKNKLVFTLRVPRGVYGVITPWNWPLTMATELIAPALAGGNAVVWAPATSTSAISVKLMECLAEADLPAGAVNLVTGPGSVVGDEIAGHPLTTGVGFVGSTETGRSVARRAAGKHVMLELGGNGPIVIFEDANLSRAAEGTITGCFLCAGQSCTAGERILVQRGVQDTFLAELKTAMQTVTLGDPFDEATTMGPLNNEGVALKMDEHVADAIDRGATLVTGGHRADGFPTSLYYEATVLRNVSPGMRVNESVARTRQVVVLIRLLLGEGDVQVATDVMDPERGKTNRNGGIGEGLDEVEATVEHLDGAKAEVGRVQEGTGRGGHQREALVHRADIAGRVRDRRAIAVDGPI